ncbi:ABC transporter ATP-binding protein [Ruegeria faecimaris]|uniref:Putative hydroxymethylpyrimidine transport system ATP-binding protein n=1 Tax=Ruegeria faecimaris TaxID=686389 RepID=A0A521DFE6_9RHOB|nr:ABC transporter ATP-binding protein [Ruegeria faecimaris]SMO70336.1 putative hydroxymethylpyrimidine transport system ATP-binding protein [Ruegeria faecimaris]
MTPAPDLSIKGTATIDGATLFAPLTLTLGAGQWTCLLGGSGVGKTTILRLIAGLDTGAVFTGQITAGDGAPMQDRVAYMAQDDLLLPWATVAQNVSLGARLRGKSVDLERRNRLIQRMRLQDHMTKKPAELSGGQRQRVALARTLLEDRPIVLLDEPFSALDARTRADMQDLAVEALQGRTVLLVTHDPGEAARLGQSIMVMTQQGLTPCEPPHAPAPRHVDDLETLETQGALLRLLREAVA